MSSKQHQHTTNVTSRLNKIEGHVRGIKNMALEGQECEDILIQLSAVQAALKKVAHIMLNDHLEHCITCEMSSAEREQAVERLKRAINMLP